MQKAMSFNNVAIVYVKGSAYRIHFWYMSKDDAINIINGSIWLINWMFYIKYFLLCIKLSERNSVDSTYYQRNRDVIQNRAKKSQYNNE